VKDTYFALKKLLAGVSSLVNPERRGSEKAPYCFSVRKVITKSIILCLDISLSGWVLALPGGDWYIYVGVAVYLLLVAVVLAPHGQGG
jgi:hypothetical protein